MYDLKVFLFKDSLISSLRRLISNAACNSSLGIEKFFIGATLAFPKTKAIFVSFVTRERPRRKATKQNTSRELSPNICSTIWSTGVSKKQRAIFSRPIISKPVCQSMNFLEVHLIMVHPTAGPRYAKYPSVKAGHERCTGRLNRLGRKPWRRNLSWYLRNRFCYIFVHATTNV